MNLLQLNKKSNNVEPRPLMLKQAIHALHYLVAPLLELVHFHLDVAQPRFHQLVELRLNVIAPGGDAVGVHGAVHGGGGCEASGGVQLLDGQREQGEPWPRAIENKALYSFSG